jgi:large subunit ribosomal protein L23
MAIFGSKKEKKTETTEKVAVLSGASRDLSRIIIRPVITEKAAVLGDRNVYAFEVARSATKFDVRAAVQKLWNVTPTRINIVNRVPRSFVVRAKNRVGTHPGQRKAYVFLKKGDRIDLV